MWTFCKGQIFLRRSRMPLIFGFKATRILTPWIRRDGLYARPETVLLFHLLMLFPISGMRRTVWFWIRKVIRRTTSFIGMFSMSLILLVSRQQKGLVRLTSTAGW